MTSEAWKAMHWETPSPKPGARPGGRNVRDVRKSQGQGMPSSGPPAPILAPRASVNLPLHPPGYDDYVSSSLLYKPAQTKLEPLGYSPGHDSPLPVRVDLKAMERSPPHNQVTLQPLGQGPTAGVPREVVAALEARLAALEARTLGVEHISAEALKASGASSEHLEGRIFKLGTALSRSEAEVAALRQGAGAAEQQRQQLEARLQQAVNDRIAANSDLQDQKFRLENAEREAHEAKALAYRLEGLVAYEKDLFSQENMTRQDHQMALREEGRRREAVLSHELMEMSREVEVAKQVAATARNDGMAAFDQLSGRLDAAESYLGQQQQQQQTLGAEGAGALQGEVMELRGQIGSLQAHVMELEASRRSDQQLAAIGAKDLEAKVAAAEADVLRRTMSMVESRNKELMRRCEGLEEQVNDRLNSKAADDEDRLNHVAKGVAREKKNALERMIVMERSVRELLAKQEESDEATRRLVQRGQDDFNSLVSRSKQEQQEREAELREQVNGALVKIRGYTRDMEEALERERLGLEEVLRMEIKSRMSSTTKLKEALAKTKHEVRGELKGLRTGLTERLEHLEKKLHVLLAAERKLYARQTGLEGGLARHRTQLDQKLGVLTDELEGLVVDQVLSEDVMKEDVMGQLETGYDVLREALSSEFMAELTELKDRNDSDLIEALDAINEDHSVFHEDIQRQITELSEQSSLDLQLIQEVAAETHTNQEESQQALEGMQMQLDEMLDGLVEEIEQSTVRAEQVKSDLHNSVQRQLAEVTGQITDVQGRVDDVQHAQQALLEDVDALDDRGRKLMDVLEQEVEAREAGVDRLSESLAALEAKAAQDLDDVRQAAEADREQTLHREEMIAAEMKRQVAALEEAQDQCCQDLDEVAGAVSELPGPAELEELEARLNNRVEALQMAQEATVVVARAAQAAADVVHEANVEGWLKIESRLAQFEEEMVTGSMLAEALVGQVTPESVANLRDEVAELQSDLKLTEEVLRAEADVAAELSETTAESLVGLNMRLDGLAGALAASEAMVSTAVTADDVQLLRDGLDAAQTAVAESSQATADLTSEVQGPLKEELAQLVDDRLTRLREEMAAETQAKLLDALMDNLKALTGRVEELSASAQLQDSHEERLATVEGQLAQQGQEETELSIISAELHAKVQALSASMLKKIEGLREEMLDNLTDAKLDTETLRTDLVQQTEGLAQLVTLAGTEEKSAPAEAVATEDSQQSTINVKLVEASEFTARRMATLEQHAEEIESQLSSEMNDWTGKLVETQEMVSDRLGALEGQSDELVRSMSVVRRALDSMQSDVDELHAELGQLRVQGGPAANTVSADPSTAAGVGAQESMLYRLQSLERQAAMGPEPGEFNRAINTVMEMLGGLQADMDQVRAEVDVLSAAGPPLPEPAEDDDHGRQMTSELRDGQAALSAKVEALEALSDLTRAQGEAQTAVAGVVRGLQAEVECLRGDLQGVLHSTQAAEDRAEAAEVSAEASAKAARGAMEAITALEIDVRTTQAVPAGAGPINQEVLDSTLQRMAALEIAGAGASDALAAIETKLIERIDNIERQGGAAEDRHDQAGAPAVPGSDVRVRMEKLEAAGAAAAESLATLEAAVLGQIGIVEAVERPADSLQQTEAVSELRAAMEERMGELETASASIANATAAMGSKVEEQLGVIRDQIQALQTHHGPAGQSGQAAGVGSEVEAHVARLETDIKEQLEAMSSEVEAVQESQVLSEQLQAVDARVAAVEGRVEAVEAQLPSQQGGNSGPAEEDVDVMARLGAVESSLEEKLATLGSRVQELASAVAADGGGEEEVTAIRERLAVVEGRLDEAPEPAHDTSSAEKTATAAASMAESALQAATAGLRELREIIDGSDAGRREAESDLEVATSAAKKQLEGIQSAVEGLKSDVAQIRKQLSESPGTSDAQESLETEFRSMRSDLKKLAGSTQNLEDSQAAVGGAASWPTHLAEAREEIEGRLDEQQQAIEELRLQAEDVKAVNERTGALQEALGGAQHGLSELRGQLEALQATVDQHAADRKAPGVSSSGALGAAEASEGLGAVRQQMAEFSTRLEAQEIDLAKVSTAMLTEEMVSGMLGEALGETSKAEGTQVADQTLPTELKSEVESHRAALDEHSEKLRQLEDNMLSSEAVQEQILDVLTEQQLVGHSDVQQMLEGLKEEVTSEMEAGRDIQNDLAESYEEVLSDIEQQVKDLGDRLEEKDHELRGAITEEVEGQLAEWRAEIFQELKGDQ